MLRQESEIVAQAGRFNSVTIATNMAGRGTDIVLGGNPEFLAKRDMLKKGYEEHIVNTVSSPIIGEDPVVLEAKPVYDALYAAHKLVTDAEAEQVKAEPNYDSYPLYDVTYSGSQATLQHRRKQPFGTFLPKQ